MNTIEKYVITGVLVVASMMRPDICSAFPYQNLALLQSVGASSAAPNHPPAFVVDGDDGTFWNSAEGDENPWVVVYLKSYSIVDHVVLPLFSGFEEIRIEVYTDSAWLEVYKGKKHSQVLFGFQPVKTGAVRLVFDTKQACIDQ